MATTYDKASLVMIPSGVKESKLYSIKPTSGDGDFTFSRGTDTATRVNASGLIEKERGNTILYSNDFNTGYSKTRASLVSGQSGYDGTNDAWGFVDDTNNSTHLIVQTIASSEVATFSVYAKKGAVDFMAFRYEDASVEYAYFDLANGTLGTIASGYIDAKIEAVGATGWYRCEATRTSANKVVILSAQSDNDPTYAGAGTTAIYIQDAMLNQGLVAQPYIETTTAAVYEGITDNLPRLDYSGGASCPSLLLEPSRTNVIEHSEYLGEYGVSNVSVSYNNATSPEGVQNATFVTGDSGTATKVVNFNPSANGAYTISVFAKYDSHQWIQLGMGGVATYANFDIQNGVVGGTNGTSDIEDYGNGWYRCSVQMTSGTPLSHYIGMVDNGSAARLASSSSTNSFWAYGMQSEIGSYPTSYIPTYGASASRAGDANCVTASPSTSLFGQTEGTIFCEYTPVSDNTTNQSRFIRLRNSSNSNQIYMQHNALNNINAVVFNGSNQFVGQTPTGYVSVGNTYKFALGYKDGDYVFYANGVQIEAGTATGLGTLTIDRLDLDNANISKSSKVNQALVFKTRLTNAELAALTTI